ncbi:uncharacterized protein LOC115674315 [Syzygium oleosum]|uniref:uncharacterized protein LOC115674315 n=1 Tax=Syzygium oleosum TaxID=219896 RepID=UPI0011D211D9|nr:uncharacterized protein LOC115674315 [Syzygium oleosum]
MDHQSTAAAAATSSPAASPTEPASKARAAILALSSIVTTVPPFLSSSESPALALLHDPDVASQVSSLLRRPDSGSGDDNLCRWLYDTFHSGDPDLQLVVLRHVPTVAGVYLSRASQRKPHAGFECVLLALYAHVTTARGGQSVTVTIPDVSHPSVYHETRDSSAKSIATDLNLAVVSPSLEPHGTVRSSRRSRIVGIALELYHSRIAQMPVGSKIDFCEFCVVWSGLTGDPCEDDAEEIGDANRSRIEGQGTGSGRITMPWELLQPALRILGHCMLGPAPAKEKERLEAAAAAACRSLYARSLHDIDPMAILATGSLLRLRKIGLDSGQEVVDHTEIPHQNVIVLSSSFGNLCSLGNDKK